MNYTIVQVKEGKKYPYFDPFSGKVYESDKATALKVAFMLMTQHDGLFEVEEVV